MIKKIGKRTQERIKKYGTEKDFFKKIWDTREHFCEICGKYISIPCSYSFSHNLGKGRYPEYRYTDENITLVCSIDCHMANDKKNKGMDQTIISHFPEKKGK